MKYYIGQKFYDIVSDNDSEVEITDIHCNEQGHIEGFTLRRISKQWFITTGSFQEYYRESD